MTTCQTPTRNKLFEIDLTFNEKKQTLEGSLLVDSGKKMGQWKIHSIRVQDTGGMETGLFNSDVDWVWQYHDIVELRDKNVLVSGTTLDYTNPVIKAESLIVDKTEVELGEEIFISIKASDNQEVLEGNANFMSINTKSLKNLSMNVPLIFNSETSAYEGTLSFTDALSYGDWVLENISFKDLNENKSTLSNAPSWYISDTENNQYKDLSRFNISVKGKFPTLTVKDMETEVNQSII